MFVLAKNKRCVLLIKVTFFFSFSLAAKNTKCFSLLLFQDVAVLILIVTQDDFIAQVHSAVLSNATSVPI